MSRCMVTRTITTTDVEALCYNNGTEEMEVHVYTVPRAFDIEDAKQEKKLKKLVAEQVESNADADLTLVKIKKCEKHETLYGMSEADFIAGAKILPPRDANKKDAE